MTAQKFFSFPPSVTTTLPSIRAGLCLPGDFPLFIFPLLSPFKKENHRNSEGLHREMLTTTCHRYRPSKPLEFLHRWVYSLLMLDLSCSYSSGWGGKPNQIPFNHWRCPANNPLFFFLGGKFWLRTSKRYWKLIVLCNITPLYLPSSRPPVLPISLLSITWNLGKALILHPADWLAAVLSHLPTFCQALIICCWLSAAPPLSLPPAVAKKLL